MPSLELSGRLMKRTRPIRITTAEIIHMVRARPTKP